MFHCDGDPWKHGSNTWNHIPICFRAKVITISGFCGRHIDLCMILPHSYYLIPLVNETWLCRMWNLVIIERTFRKLFRFSKFQNGGRQLSWSINFRILRQQASFGCRVGAKIQIWCESDEPFWSYFTFSKFTFFGGGHLGFGKMTFLTLPFSGRCQDETPCQIWWWLDKWFGSYSTFC